MSAIGSSLSRIGAVFVKELNDRNPQHHGEGQPIAPHLDQLFNKDGADP